MKVTDLEIVYNSVKGPREENQDAYCVVHENDGIRLGVFDGLGGHANGRETAELVALVVGTVDACAEWEDVIHEANQQVKKMGERKGYTTVAGVRFREERNGTLFMELCNCGDSRVYLFRDNEVHQLSKDHTTQAELMSYGVSEERALLNRKLTSCIGMEQLELYLCEGELEKGDLFLLATDGVWELLEEKKEMDRIRRLRTAEEKAKYIQSQMTFYRNELEDNATYILAYLPE